MSEGSIALSPFASNCWAMYVKALLEVVVVVSRLLIFPPTRPAACAGVLAVSLTELTKTTLVAALPTIVTVAPLWKPVPLIVMGTPPVIRPAEGTMLAMVGSGAADLTVMLAVFASEQPGGVVTVTFNDVVPIAPAVKVMLAVPAPAVIEPLVMPQT